ncbi:MAG TPA: ABC transporter permease [Ktedonobacteraceae bacterium]|nr:ABC transporter permease [Ktedonobacteraceae bacterium]
MRFLLETRLLLGRCLRGTLRNPVWIVLGLFQPVLYLLLFAPLLDNLKMPGFAHTNSLNVFTPGLLVMMALFSAGFAGFNVCQDLRSGVIERLRVTPASRVAMLLGMVLRDVIIFIVQCALLVLIAMLMGMTVDPLGMLILFGLMTVIAVMMASASYAVGFILKNEGSLAAALNTVTLPLMLLSGVMLPLSLAPQILQNIASFTPFSHAVDAARALVNGHLGDQSIGVAFTIVGVLLLLAVFWATRVFRKAVA